jgi:DNA-binding transcriptional LysR family regulator
MPGARGSSLPVLAYTEESGLGRILRAVGATAPDGARLEQVFTSHLAVVLKRMALDGRGVAWLPLSLIGDELGDGRLVRAGGEAWLVPVEIRLVRRRAAAPPAAEAFWRIAEAGNPAP